MFRRFFLGGGDPKLGITTPRWSGNAVQRNRTKRIMREFYRNKRSEFPEQGAILYVLKRCDDRVIIESEMLRLSKRVEKYIDSIDN